MAQGEGEPEAGQTRAHTGFRPAIEGLRGLAVSLVLLAHFGVPGSTSGFIGVDVFYVISGFLITGLLAREYRTSAKAAGGYGRISLLRFYARRARRILPSAVLVIVVTNASAYALLNPVRASQIAGDSLWALFFAGNLLFLNRSTDYFFAGFGVSPFQHYWSLGVEEQFYVVWPVLFLTAASLYGLRIRNRDVRWHARAFWLLVALTLASAIAMPLVGKGNPSLAYFSPATRFWEVGAGSLLALALLDEWGAATQRLRAYIDAHAALLQSIGLAGLLVSLAVVRPENFAFTLALPVLATALVLLGETGQPIRSVLTLAPARWLGRISFPLYLWHWPVLILGAELHFIDDATSRALAFAACILLAWLTHVLVEAPCMRIPVNRLIATARRARTEDEPLRRGQLVAVASVLVLCLTGASVPQATPAISSLFDRTPAAGPINIASVPTDSDLLTQLPGGAFTTEADIPAAWRALIVGGIKLKTVPANMEPPLDRLLADHAAQWQACLANDPKQGCEFGSATAPKTAVIIGDSYGLAVMPTVVAALGSVHWRVFLLSMALCMASDTVPTVNGSSAQKCLEHRKAVMAWLRDVQPDLVVVSESPQVDIQLAAGLTKFQTWQAGFRRTLDQLKLLPSQILLLGPPPGTPPLTDCVDREMSLRNCMGVQGLKSQYRLEMQKASDGVNVRYVNESFWMCSGGQCPPIIDNTPVYWDGGHLSRTFAEKVAPLLQNELRAMGLAD